MTATKSIIAQRIRHSYGDREALRGVDFEVPTQSIFGFVGPNGGGKTTLFHLLSTLMPIQDGTVTALGFDLSSDISLYRQQIGVTFQAPGLDRRLTVRENLVHQGHLYGLRGAGLTKQIDVLLNRFGVDDRADEIVDTLSGGLKRRAELAKCLLHNPQLILLDEPSTGLDPRARSELWTYLEEVRAKESVTVVVTTHLMEEAERCDELILLDRGSIVAHGTPSQMRHDVSGDSVTLVCGQPDELRQQILSETGIDFSRAGEKLKVRSEDGQSILREVMEKFGASIQSMSLDKPSLEDVFMEKTGREFSVNDDQD